MPSGFLPTRDDALLAWSLNFSTSITASPTTYGLSAPLATGYATLHSAFATTLAAVDPGIRNKAAVAAKNTARTNLKNNARLLAKLVEGTATVTNAQKLTLGLNVRAMPTPVPVPAFAPGLDVISVSGFTARIKLHDTQSASKRGKPVGVIGASVFTHVGPTAPPTDIANWTFQGNTGRTVINVEFPNTLAAGTTVWFTAFWFNPAKQSGPTTAPVSTNLQGGTVTTLAA